MPCVPDHRCLRSILNAHTISNHSNISSKKKMCCELSTVYLFFCKRGENMETQLENFWKHFENYGTPQCNEPLLVRVTEALWKAVTSADFTQVSGSRTPITSNPNAGMVEIGRNLLTDSEKWKLQAALRREETKIGGNQYNKKVTRATKSTKGPTTGEGFPAGRGRPVRIG